MYSAGKVSLPPTSRRDGWTAEFDELDTNRAPFLAWKCETDSETERL